MHEDLPLFSLSNTPKAVAEKPAPKPAPRPARAKRAPKPAPAPKQTARIYMFPPHRDRRYIALMLTRYLSLRKRFPRAEAHTVFSEKYESILQVMMRQRGMTQSEIRAEVVRVRWAMKHMQEEKLGLSQPGGLSA